MKILFISAFPPCEKTAGQDYSRRLIIDLIEKGHNVSLIYAEYPNHNVSLPDSVVVLMKIQPSLKNCLIKPCFHPFYTKRFDKEVLNYIESIKNEYDMIYFDFSQVHLYSYYIKHDNKVLMCHDIILQKYERKGKFQIPFIKQSENRCLKSSNKIYTFSKKDSDFLLNHYNIKSRPVNFYLKNGKYNYMLNEIEPYTFCFYGAWNRSENTECLVWFFENVYKSLKTILSFIVIGGGMNYKLQEKLRKYKNVKYLGFVDDPVLEVSKCQALIAPLKKGAGVKVKVIDALSSGTSVLGTDVAFEGIEDNKNNQLFYRLYKAEEYANILNNWNNKSVNDKQNAADEFFINYNTNHFTDLL